MFRRTFAVLGVAAIVAVCIVAGLWQLRRHDERRAYNHEIEKRTAMPVADAATLLASEAPDRLRFRRVRATGRYDTAREIVLDDHPLDGVAGNHVVTPLVLDDGRALLVDRGWVPITEDTPPVTAAAAPAGTVTVEGVVFPSEVRRLLGPKTPQTGAITHLFRIEIPRLQQQMPYALLPMWVQLQSETPPQPGALPKRVPLRRLSTGPHLGYAAQWFTFAALAIVGAVVLARRARRRPRRNDERGPHPAPVRSAER